MLGDFLQKKSSEKINFSNILTIKKLEKNYVGFYKEKII